MTLSRKSGLPTINSIRVQVLNTWICPNLGEAAIQADRDLFARQPMANTRFCYAAISNMSLTPPKSLSNASIPYISSFRIDSAISGGFENWIVTESLLRFIVSWLRREQVKQLPCHDL